ncbi:MAG: hypothetical protein WDO56_06895 [Gammaproteobacteria bacterium]
MLTPKLTRLYAVLVFLLASAPSVAAQAEARQPFGIDDYFRLQHVSELALSSDGKMLAYVLRRPSLEQNKIVQTVYVSATKPAAVPFAIDSIQQARALPGIPGDARACVSGSEDGRVQVFSIDSESGRSKGIRTPRRPCGSSGSRRMADLSRGSRRRIRIIDRRLCTTGCITGTVESSSIPKTCSCRSSSTRNAATRRQGPTTRCG